MKKMFRNLLWSVLLCATASCSQEVLVEEVDVKVQLKDATIRFSDTNPVNGTRASLTATEGFPTGTEIGVYGFQTSTGNSTDRIFSNQKVKKVSADTWTYSPLRYWNLTSTYAFHAIYPYSTSAYAFDETTGNFSVEDFVVANTTDEQTDVMIAQKNATHPYNLVELQFDHLLSNVNFYFKTVSTFDFAAGVSKVEVVSFDVEGLNSTGDYLQNGFDATGRVLGAWTVDGTDVYDHPVVTAGEVTSATEVIALSQDLLLLPQDLSDAAKVVKLSYRIHYTDGTSCFLQKEVPLAKAAYTGGALTVWNPNCIYNYTLAVNPAINADGTSNVIDFTASVEEWEQEIDAEIPVK